MWLSCLSLEDKAIPFYQQKEQECAWLERQINGISCTKSTYTSKEVDLGPIEDTDKKQIYRLMDDMITRVETKNFEEAQIT